MTAPRSRASSTSRCCRSASRAHASCSSISPGCTRRSPRRSGRPRSAPSAGWSATTCATTRTSSTSRPTCPTRRRSGRSAWRTRWRTRARRATSRPSSRGAWSTCSTCPSTAATSTATRSCWRAHEPLIAAASDRVTVLGLGASAGRGLARALPRAGDEPDRRSRRTISRLLGVLAEFHVGDAQPEAIAGPREPGGGQPRAARARAGAGARHAGGRAAAGVRAVGRRRHAARAHALSLAAPRRAPRAAGRAGRGRATGKLPDVNRFAEPFKRLGERLHPHEYPRFATAQDVFAVARGERAARSLAGRVELALAAGDVGGGDRRARQRARDAAAQRRPPGSRGRGARRSRTRCARPPRRSPRACCCRCASTCSTAPAPRPCACSSTSGAARG